MMERSPLVPATLSAGTTLSWAALYGIGAIMCDASPLTSDEGPAVWSGAPLICSVSTTMTTTVATTIANWLQRVEPEPVVLNHRGTPARLTARGRQFDRARPEEIVALQLLRKMVAPDVFRRYLRDGFVSVRGASGLVYQIDRVNLISVWDRGARVCTLCVHMRDRLPPTDEVVAKMLIVECDEPDIWRRANVRWLTSRRDLAPLQQIARAA